MKTKQKSIKSVSRYCTSLGLTALLLGLGSATIEANANNSVTEKENMRTAKACGSGIEQDESILEKRPPGLNRSDCSVTFGLLIPVNIFVNGPERDLKLALNKVLLGLEWRYYNLEKATEYATAIKNTEERLKPVNENKVSVYELERIALSKPSILEIGPALVKSKAARVDADYIEAYALYHDGNAEGLRSLANKVQADVRNSSKYQEIQNALNQGELDEIRDPFLKALEKKDD
jgi:hypothetical protein